MTFLSSLFTKTQEAPLSFMHVLAQALCAAFAPFAPQELSLIQPVHVIVLLSAMVARLSVANNTASKPNVPIALFICVPPQICSGSPGQRSPKNPPRSPARPV